MAIPTNSMEHIFGAGDRRAKALNLKEKLTEGSLEGRKAVHHLIKQINNDTTVTVGRDAEGKLRWSVGNTPINFAEATEGPSFWERIKHKWNMAFDTEYQNEFAATINKIVIAYSKFNLGEGQARIAKEQADVAAQAAAEAAAQAEADAAAQAVLDAAAAKAAQIANLNEQIDAKGEAYLAQFFAKSQQESQKAVLEAQNEESEQNKSAEMTNKNQAAAQHEALRLVAAAKDELFSIEVFWTDAELDLAKSAALSLGVDLEQIKDKTYRDSTLLALRALYDNSGMEIRIHNEDIQGRNSLIANLNNNINEHTAAMTALQAEIAALTAELLVLEPAHAADVPAPDAPPADVPAAAAPVVSAERQEAIDLGLTTEAEIVHYVGLNPGERQLYRNLRQPNDAAPVSSAFADFITALAKGRMTIFSNANEGKTQTITFNPVVVNIKFDILEGKLTLPSSITLTYSEENKDWTLGGDVKLLKDGHEIKLNNTKFNIDNDQVKLTVNNDWFYQDTAVALYLGLNNGMHYENAAVTEMVFKPEFIQEEV